MLGRVAHARVEYGHVRHGAPEAAVRHAEAHDERERHHERQRLVGKRVLPDEVTGGACGGAARFLAAASERGRAHVCRAETELLRDGALAVLDDLLAGDDLLP